jgi:hypothetical protein
MSHYTMNKDACNIPSSLAKGYDPFRPLASEDDDILDIHILFYCYIFTRTLILLCLGDVGDLQKLHYG